jgi:hypothetical protein
MFSPNRTPRKYFSNNSFTMIKKKNKTAIFLLITFIITCQVNSQVIFSDAFNHPTGALSGQSGGTGWSGAWSDIGSGSQILNGWPGTNDNYVKITTNAIVTSRSLASPVNTDGQTLYLAFLFKASPFSPAPLGDYAGITLTGGVGNNLFFGMPGGEAGLGYDWTNENIESWNLSASNTNYLVLFKIQSISGATTLKMYVSTNLTLNGSTLENATYEKLSFTGSTSNFSNFNKVEISGGYSASGSIKIAGLAMATTANAAVSATQTALPVSWLSFTGQKNNQSAELNWSTANEQNTKNFEILHSIDANNWTIIGKVDAAGNSNTVRRYSFIHTSPFKNNVYNYYRIKQLDLDEKFSFSKIISLNYNESSQEIIAYPNPAYGKLTVFISENQEAKLINLSGNTVWKSKFVAGRHDIITRDLPKGIYTLQIGNSARKIIIQ